MDDDATLHASAISGNPRPSLEIGGELIGGRYRLLELLGAGGMGTVYRAHDTELDEVVALKTLRRELVDAPGALDRFRRELKLARRVTHRGVARAFDMGDHQGERFLTMEYVDGAPLTRKLEAGRGLPVAVGVQIARDVADALCAAHAVGVVHRDLKPDNVLIASDGRVVLTDFGVARLVEGGDARATRAGMVVGTPAYMAPEQVEGREVSARADLYALGVMLFEMLSGELPFVADTPLGMAAMRLSTPPRDLGAIAPGIPASLLAVVASCLARDPAERPPSAEALSALLARVDTSDVAPTPKRASEPPPKVPGPDSSATRRLAVAPFRVTGPDTEPWMAEAVAEDLIDALSMTRGLKVRARTSAYLTDESPADFGARHGVDVVVDGSLRRDGERVRLALRLVSVVDGFQIWAERSDGGVKDLLALCDQGASSIAKALAGTSHEVRPKAATSGEAIEFFLRAKRASNQLDIGEDAVELIEKAVALAPDDPNILASFAVIATRALVLRPRNDDLAVRAHAAAAKALTLAPNLPEAHVALARSFGFRGDYVTAMRELVVARRATESNANLEHLIGRLLVDTDEITAARKHFERALWVDPHHHFSRVDLIRIAGFEGKPDVAHHHLDLLREQSRSHFAVAAPRAALWLGPDVVNVEIEAPNAFLDAQVRITRTVLRDLRMPMDQLESLKALVDEWMRTAHLKCLAHQMIAELQGYLGDTERCLQSIDLAISFGLWDVGWMRRTPTLASSRAHPGWAAREAKVRARAEPVLLAYQLG